MHKSMDGYTARAWQTLLLGYVIAIKGGPFIPGSVVYLLLAAKQNGRRYKKSCVYFEVCICAVMTSINTDIVPIIIRSLING